MSDADTPPEDLERELRTLRKKLARSDTNRRRLELAKERSERLLRQMIDDLRTAQEIAEQNNRELEEATQGLLATNEALQRAQQQLLRSEERALAASQAKSAFLANMSHEVRTPLNAILGMTTLLERTITDGSQRELLDAARSSGEALLSMFDDVLELATLEVGKVEVHQVDVDLVDLVEDVVLLAAQRAEHKGLELVCSADSRVPPLVLGDAGRTRQILLNLMSNAVKFTDEGWVSLRLDWLDAVDETPSRARFIVEDTGVGIPPEAQAQLYQPFVQVDQSPTRRHGGTGLGLAIGRELVERLGGQIEVESSLHEGARFTVVLPFPASTMAAPPRPRLDGLRVAAVSPREVSMGGLVRVARGLGATLDAFASPAGCVEGINAAASDGAKAAPCYDALLIDARALHEPSVADLRRSPAFADATVLAVSPFTDPLDDDRLRATGCDGQLTWPVRTKRLIAALRPAAAPAENRAPGADGRRVLLVEDNPTNQRVALLLLEALGCDVHIAADGRTAVEQFRSQEYDLVLMDCQMPEMDGFEATRAMRREEVLTSADPVPIVAMTASAVEEVLERCLEAGMDGHVPKPIRPDTLEGVLRRFSPGASGPRGLASPVLGR